MSVLGYQNTIMTPICEVARNKINQVNKHCTKNVKKPSPNPKKCNKICSKCLSGTGRGKKHTCNRIQQKNNLKSIVRSERMEVSSADKIQFQVTTSDMGRIKNRLNATQNQMKMLSYELRRCNSSYSRTVVESKSDVQMLERSHVLDEFFQYIEENVDGYKSVFIYCTDIVNMINFILNERKTENIHVKIGMDSGGGTFKITVNIVEIPHDDLRVEASISTSNPKIKLSGVKKLLIVGLCTNTTENYENVAKMWKMVDMDKLFERFRCTVQGDLKIIMLSLGLMSCSSKCSCPYCDTHDLNNKGDMRTLKSITDNYQSWLASGAKKNTSSTLKTKCCVNFPIFDIDEKTIQTIDICSPPELHLMLGVVNRIYLDLNTTRMQPMNI